MLVVEIIAWAASAAYLANNTIIQPAFEITSRAEGLKGFYHGFGVEDPSKAYITMIWTSHEASNAFVADTEAFSAMQSYFRPAVAAGTRPTIGFYESKSNRPAVPFDAPVTEFTIAKLKEGKTERDFDEVIARLACVLRKFPGRHDPSAYGELEGAEGTYYINSGWDSVELHTAAIRSEDVAPALAGFIEVANVTQRGVHIAFNRYPARRPSRH